MFMTLGIELTYICKKAEAWRGNEGEIRKIIVNDFIWREDDVENDSDKVFLSMI